MKDHGMFRLAAIAAFCVLVAGCGGEPTPEIMAGVDGCASCGMVIDRVNEAAGWIEGGDFVPFCSPGCLLAEHDALRRSGQTPPEAVFLADYRDGTFAPAVETAFLLTDHVPTVMNARVVCFNSVMAAGDMRQHEDEIVTDWTGYRVLRGFRGDRVIGNADTRRHYLVGDEIQRDDCDDGQRGDDPVVRLGKRYFLAHCTAA